MIRQFVLPNYVKTEVLAVQPHQVTLLTDRNRDPLFDLEPLVVQGPVVTIISVYVDEVSILGRRHEVYCGPGKRLPSSTLGAAYCATIEQLAADAHDIARRYDRWG